MSSAIAATKPDGRGELFRDLIPLCARGAARIADALGLVGFRPYGTPPGVVDRLGSG